MGINISRIAISRISGRCPVKLEYYLRNFVAGFLDVYAVGRFFNYDSLKVVVDGSVFAILDNVLDTA